MTFTKQRGWLMPMNLSKFSSRIWDASGRAKGTIVGWTKVGFIFCVCSTAPAQLRCLLERADEPNVVTTRYSAWTSSCLMSVLSNFHSDNALPSYGPFYVGWSNQHWITKARKRSIARVGSTSWATRVDNDHRGTSAQDGSKCRPHCSYGTRVCGRTGVAQRTHEARWERDLSTDGGTRGFVCCILGTLIQVKHWWLERTNGRLTS